MPPYNMYLGSHLEPVLVPGVGNNTNTTNPFEYYQRLSITRPDSVFDSSNELEHIAIDIDIPSRLYRVLHLNATDTENEYLAHGYKNSLGPLSTFHPLSSILISNGTFTPVTARNKNMLIPELSIGIANMHGFITDNEQRPFAKIFQNLSPYWRTETLGASPTLLPVEMEKFTRTLNEPWDSKKQVNKDHEIIMRTASFGLGRKRLDMCVKEDMYLREGKEVSVGVFEELWVPFAIMASYRERMFELSGYDSKSQIA
jgi:hypothetical protein